MITMIPREAPKVPRKATCSEARVFRKCPHCGHTLYAKLSQCDGTIEIKCDRCRRLVTMNLALRKIPKGTHYKKLM